MRDRPHNPLSPRRIQEGSRLQVEQQPSLGIKDGDEALCGTMRFVVASALFPGISHHHISAHVLNVKRSKALGDASVAEGMHA